MRHLISIAWRLSAMFFVIIVNLAVYFSLGVALSVFPTIILGVIMGEVTKIINIALTGKREVSFLAKKPAKKTVAKKKKK